MPESEEGAAGQQQGRRLTAADFSFLITKTGTVVENPDGQVCGSTDLRSGQNEALFKKKRTGRLEDSGLPL